MNIYRNSLYLCNSTCLQVHDSRKRHDANTPLHNIEANSSTTQVTSFDLQLHINKRIDTSLEYKAGS